MIAILVIVVLVVAVLAYLLINQEALRIALSNAKKLLRENFTGTYYITVTIHADLMIPPSSYISTILISSSINALVDE